jgi:hypothetical protein
VFLCGGGGWWVAGGREGGSTPFPALSFTACATQSSASDVGTPMKFGVEGMGFRVWGSGFGV